MKKILFAFGIISVLCLFTSCLSTKVSPGKKTDLYCLELPVSKKQDFTFRIYGVRNGNTIDVTNVYWFDNWGNGWTEALFVASGIIDIKQKNNKTQYYTVAQALNLEYPEAAKIRYKDTYLSIEESIRALSNRIERLNSMNEVIAENHKDLDYSDFDSYYRDYLFPEKFKKSEFRAKLNYKSEKTFGDGTFWNNEYTESVFPEYMWDARSSGTLFRDWEEGFDLLYILYNWDKTFGDNAKGELNVYKTKATKSKIVEE